MTDALRLLLVDDDELDREQVIQRVGGQAIVVQAGDAGSGRAAAATERFDCVLLDYRLPDADGTELCAELTSLGVPGVMLTGIGGEAVATEALRAGADDYLCKNGLTTEALLSAVRRASDKGRLREALRHTRAELESFAATVAHDVRAPLNRSLQYARMAADDAAAGELAELPELLGLVVQDIELALRLIAEMRAYTQLHCDAPRPQAVDGNEVLDRARQLASEQLTSVGGTLDIGPIPLLHVERDGAVRVFYNLISNALRFRAPDRAPRITVRARREDGAVVVEVADNGVGIEAARLDRVQQPFERGLDADGQRSSGLGLAIVSRLLWRVGGRLEVHSVVGEGTTMRVRVKAA